jgi:hypothetical protein
MAEAQWRRRNGASVVRRAPRWRRAGLAVDARDAELLRRPPGELDPPRLLLIRPLLGDLGNKRRRRRRVVAEGGPLRAHTAKVVAACVLSGSACVNGCVFRQVAGRGGQAGGRWQVRGVAGAWGGRRMGVSGSQVPTRMK